MQRFRDGMGWVIEDPVTRRFFRVGLREKEFLQLLDGRRTVSDAVAAHAAMDPARALPDTSAAATVRWLIEQGLIETAEEGHSRRVGEEMREERGAQKLLAGLGGLFFVRIPLGSPDAFLGRLLPIFRWAFSGWFFAIWLVVVGFALARLGAGWRGFLEEGGRFLATGNPLLPVACWAGLKVLHELWHGLACKRYGGGVHDAGIILLLFMTPMGYVDASSSLRFPSRRHRMAVAAAGMFIEIFVAAVAFLAWERTEPGFSRTLLHQVVMVAGIGTVLFNANPLMRFDGYYLLSDLAGIPNLYGKGQAAAAGLVGRLLFGEAKGGEDHPGFWVTAYGFAAFFWRWMVTVTLFIAAIFLFKGAGVILAAVALAAMLAQMGVGLARSVSAARRSREVRWARALLRGGAAALAALGFVLFVPVRQGEVLDGAAEFADPAILRAECPGFVTVVHVRSGDRVAVGAPLLTLENREEVAELARIENELARSELAEQSYVAEGNIAGALAQSAISSALRTRVESQRRYLATLDLRAPIAGEVLAGDLENLPGTFVSQGTELLVIVRPGELRITLAITEAQEPIARENVGKRVSFRTQGGGGAGRGVLATVEPGAALAPPHWTLSAQYGGPLAVDRAASRAPLRTGNDERASAPLAQPVFRGLVSVTPSESMRLMDGQRVRVHLFSATPITIGKLIYQFFERTVERARNADR